ncbi:hypothetical protein PENSPDRAFT_758951 [Peniophora sp. CONT]|nr:hypothetical protein PENSPDRAFT_758951 [Peniophora sp. CONT]
MKPSKTAPCKMYARGRCTKGDACDFFHDPDALWTPEHGGTWCWRYMAGVCSGQCKFRHPGPEEITILMRHTPCVIATCPRIDCPRRHDDIDFDPEFQEKQYRVQAPRLHDSFAGNAPRTASLQYAPVTPVGTISPRERAQYAAALRRALRVQVPVPAVNTQPSETTGSRSNSPADSTSSSGLDTVSTPATSRADAVDDWRARDVDPEDRAAFPHTPGVAQTFAAAGRVNGKGHARRQSVWVKKEGSDENAIEVEAGFKDWRRMGAKAGMGHARSQSWAPFSMRGTFP